MILTRSDSSRDYNVRSSTRAFRNRGMLSSDACTLLQERIIRERLRKLAVKHKMTLNHWTQTNPQLEPVWSVFSTKTRKLSSPPLHNLTDRSPQFRDPPSQRLFEHLHILASKYPNTKFVSIVGSKCISNYPDQNIPTLILYRNGEVVDQLIAWGAKESEPGTVHRESDEHVSMSVSDLTCMQIWRQYCSLWV